MNVVSTQISRVPLLSTLPLDAALRLERAAEEKHFRRRQVIFFAEQRSDSVFVVIAGRVKLIRASLTGREITMSLVNPQEIFGETGLFDPNAAYSDTAETIEDCTTLVFRRVDIETTLVQYPDLMRAFLASSYERRRQMETRLAELVFYDVSTRLAHLLASMVEQYGRSTKQGDLLRVKLTHQEIANMIGSTRETTTLILNDFRREGLIDFSGRRIIVLEAERLSQIEVSSISRVSAAKVKREGQDGVGHPNSHDGNRYLPSLNID